MDDGGAAGGAYVLVPALLAAGAGDGISAPGASAAVVRVVVLLALALGLMLLVLWLVVALVANANLRKLNTLASLHNKLLLYAHAHAPNAFEGP